MTLCVSFSFGCKIDPCSWPPYRDHLPLDIRRSCCCGHISRFWDSWAFFFFFFSKTVVLFCRVSGGIKVAGILDELGSQEMWLGVWLTWMMLLWSSHWMGSYWSPTKALNLPLLTMRLRTVNPPPHPPLPCAVEGKPRRVVGAPQHSSESTLYFTCSEFWERWPSLILKFPKNQTNNGDSQHVLVNMNFVVKLIPCPVPWHFKIPQACF